MLFIKEGKTMKTQYKGYTLIVGFDEKNIEVVMIAELQKSFTGLNQAKNYIDTLILRGGK